MASITRHIPLAAGADRVWAALRDVARPHHVFVGVLTDARLEGDDRTVTFADGIEVRERIVAIDDAARRLAYTVVDGTFAHHHASFTVEACTGGCTVTWVTDLLPDDAASRVEGLMAAGAAAMAATLEG
jgi:hypothetical protein